MIASIEDTAIAGMKILTPRVFGDARGYFAETANERDLAALGIDCHFVQDNESLSEKNVVRGLHFQKPPYAQAKLIRVIFGTIVDIALDIRVGSPTFGRHVAVELSGDNHRQVFLPPGLAHGFAVLSEKALVAYKCDAYWCREAEGSVQAADPELGINWPVAREHWIRSDKDQAAPTFASYREHPAFRSEK